MKLPLVAALVSLVALGAPAAGVTAEPPLQVGVTGSVPAEVRRNPVAMLSSERVQRLILRLAEEPAPRAVVQAALAAEPFALEDMVAVGLLREEDGLVRIDFNLLRVADQRAILAVAEEEGRDLAERLLARRGELEALAAGHAQPGVGPGEFLYAVLGCFSLDWDGLDLTAELGYRVAAQRTIAGHAFTPWAKERGAGISLRGLYWGSHNETGTAYTFTTFGDHHSLPRVGLPDLLWAAGGAFVEHRTRPEVQRAGERLVQVLLQESLDDVARVMAALWHEVVPEERLAERIPVLPARFDAILGLLEATEMVERVEGGLRARALVLAPEDAPRVRAVRQIGREVMDAWHRERYARVRARLSDLTPTRNGVPFERVYTEVWHFLFGVANRVLVQKGLFADPYAPERRWQGFLPLVWANGLDTW